MINQCSFSKIALASALAVGTVSTFAATPVGDYLNFSGFGTASIVRTNTDDAEFIRDAQRSGANRQLSPNVDSDFGLQLTATATPWLSATVQMLSVERATSHLTTEAEWAFVKVQPIEGFAIRAGRMALPMFMVSDSRNLGYANNWLRAPGEVYGLAQMSRLNGGDVSYSTQLGSSTLTASALAGTSHVDLLLQAGGFAVDNVHGMNLLLETEWATFRLGQVRAHVHAPNVPGVDNYTFSGAGMTVDRDNIFVQAEFVMRRSSGAGPIVNANGWYALTGYRFNVLMPYTSYAWTTPQTSNAPIHIDGTQRTEAIGVRWDATKYADLKFQLERVDTRNTQGISFTSAVGKPVTVGSVAIDFVF